MELAILGTTLTEAHLLNVGDEEFQLMVCGFNDLSQEPFCLVVLHSGDMDKCQIIECLGLADRISIRKVESLLGKVTGTIDVAIMIGIG
jgi:hypothetical protein